MWLVFYSNIQEMTMSKKYINEIQSNYFYSIVVIVSTFQMPIVLTFTIKHHKNKINPVVPRKLQFHEENEENLEIGEIPFHEKLHFHEEEEGSFSNDEHSKNENAISVENVEETSHLSGQICHI